MFKRRYTLIFVGSLVFLAFIIVILRVTFSYVNLNRDWTLHQLEEEVKAGSEQLQFYFGSLRSDLVRIKRYLANSNMKVDEALHGYLDFVRGVRPNAIPEILILDTNGNMVAGTNPASLQPSFRESEYFKNTQHAPNKVYLSRVIAISAFLTRSEVASKIFEDPLDLGWLLYTGVYSKGVFKGAVLFVVRSEPFFNRFSWTMNKLTSGYGFILQEDGRILFHRDVELRGSFLSDLPDSSDLAKTKLKKNEGKIMGRYVIGQQMTVTSEIYMENQRWTLGISATTSKLAQKTLTFIYTLSGLTLILGIIIFGLVFALIQLGRTKEKVRESETRFRQFFENEPEYCYMVSPEGIIVDVNNSTLKILGYKKAELVGKPLETIYAPESLPKMKKLLEKWKNAGKLADEEMFIITKKGDRRTVLLSVGVIKDADGKVLNSISVQKDITERKQAEEALRKSEEKYRELINGMNDTAWVIDFKGNFIDVNDAAVKILGYSREELLSMGPKDIDTNQKEEEIRSLIKGMATDKMQVFETIHTAKDGKKIQVEINSSLVTYQGKQAILSIARDINDRKQAEIKLQESYDQLRETFIATVNTLASTVEIRDPYTAGHQRRATILSCAIAEEMGLPEKQFDGLRMAGLVHDIGKITVPAEILSKPGQLNSTQHEMVKTHPQVGYDILKGIAFPWPVAEIVLQHHERMDGSGYPQGLSGTEIILEARILAIADVVEAMASHRPHRPGHGIDKALEEISQNREVLYDPEVVDICLKLFTEKRFTFDQLQQATGSPQNT